MTLTDEQVELKERVEHPPIEERVEPQLLEERVTRKPAPSPPPTGRRLFFGALFGLIALILATVAIVLATQGGDGEPDVATEPELPTIAAEDWVLPEVSIPVPVRVPTADWELPEMTVADGIANAARAQALAAYGLPEMTVADGMAQAWIDNYELPEMTVTEGMAPAAAANS